MKTTFSKDRAVKQTAGVLAAMANAKRLHILAIISEKEVPVGQLAEMVDLSQSALSQHLGKLRGAKLVSTRREGQTIFYSCSSSAALTLLSTLYEIFDVPQRSLTTEKSSYVSKIICA
jgi:DNA-binding transcriptional ArsR family regulator